jgi:hypothetical protein
MAHSVVSLRCGNIVKSRLPNLHSEWGGHTQIVDEEDALALFQQRAEIGAV